MKKTINGCLLALTLCATSYAKEWEDDRTMKGIMQDTMNDLKPVVAALKDANQTLVVMTKYNDAIQNLKALGFDVSSNNLETAIKQRMGLIDAAIKNNARA